MGDKKIHKLGEYIEWIVGESVNDNYKGTTFKSKVLGYGRDILPNHEHANYYLIEIPRALSPTNGFEYSSDQLNIEPMKWTYLYAPHKLLGKTLYFVNEKYVTKGELEIQIDLIKKERNLWQEQYPYQEESQDISSVI